MVQLGPIDSLLLLFVLFFRNARLICWFSFFCYYSIFEGSLVFSHSKLGNSKSNRLVQFWAALLYALLQLNPIELTLKKYL